MASPGLIPPRVIRAIKNDPRMGNGITAEADGVMGPAVPVSGKSNATCGTADFHRMMIAACVLGISAFGYAAAIRRAMTSKPGLPDRHRALPCGEWIRNVIARVDAPLPADSFAGKISEQAAILEGLGKLSGRMGRRTPAAAAHNSGAGRPGPMRGGRTHRLAKKRGRRVQPVQDGQPAGCGESMPARA